MVSDLILNTLRSARSKITDVSGNLYSTFQSISEAKYDSEHIKHLMHKSYALSKDEKEIIKLKYGSVIPCISRGYVFYQAMKALDTFNPDYIPSSYYYPYLLDVLNPMSWKKVLCNKSLFKLFYQCGIKQPITPLRSIAGVYFNSDNQPISTDEAVKIMKSIDSPVLIKPSTDSNSGNGIRFIEVENMLALIEEVSNRSIINKSGVDFVIQLPVLQSPDTEIFNPSSLNCMRITTLNLNGVVTTHSMTIKCGPKNSRVDNIGSGKRGVIVGVSADGSLAPFGFYGNGEITDKHCGVMFKDKRIRAFDKVIDAAKILHGMIESCAVIGWDIALDSANDPVLIEGNTNYPGISLEQMCSGPIFGDRTDEVVRYIVDNKRISKSGGG